MQEVASTSSKEQLASIQVDALPSVYKIISDAERTLSMIMGSKVCLRMYMNEDKMSKPEALQTVLQQMVCTEYEVNWGIIAGISRRRINVDARSAYCYLAKKYLGHSLKHIGEMLNRDHSTIIHMIRRANNFIDMKDYASEPILKIEKKLYEDFYQTKN